MHTGANLRVARRVPQGVRRHALGAADRGRALPRRLRARRGRAAENVRYMEVRYSPMLHTRRGLKLTTVVEAVLAGLRAAQDGDRASSRTSSSAASATSPRDLARDGRARGRVQEPRRRRLRPRRRRVRPPGQAPPARRSSSSATTTSTCTIHAGEAYGPESIAQAMHVCGAHRIGHGCRLREDGDLLHYVNDHRIPLECCPSSNVQTGAVPDLASHPLKLYFNLGLRVTVNTDNRLITDTTVSKELWLATRRWASRSRTSARSSCRASRARSCRSTRRRSCSAT